MALVTRAGRRPQNYRLVAKNERGDWCGHRHTHFVRASRCARSWERHYRRIYGEKQLWTVSRVEAGDL